MELGRFKIFKVIGRGRFGEVCLVDYLDYTIFATKRSKKKISTEQEQTENTLLEMNVIQTVDCDFLCYLDI